MKRLVKDHGRSALLTYVSFRDIFKFRPMKRNVLTESTLLGHCREGRRKEFADDSARYYLESLRISFATCSGLWYSSRPSTLVFTWTDTTERSSDALKVPRSVALMPSGVDGGPEVTHSVGQAHDTSLGQPAIRSKRMLIPQ